MPFPTFKKFALVASLALLSLFGGAETWAQAQSISLGTTDPMAEDCAKAQAEYREITREFQKGCRTAGLGNQEACRNVLDKCSQSEEAEGSGSSAVRLFSSAMNYSDARVDFKNNACDRYQFASSRDFAQTAYSEAKTEAKEYQDKLDDRMKDLMDAQENSMQDRQRMAEALQKNANAFDDFLQKAEASLLKSKQDSRKLITGTSGAASVMAAKVRKEYMGTVLKARSLRRQAIQDIRNECLAQAQALLAEINARTQMKRATYTYNRNMFSMMIERNKGKRNVQREKLEREKLICMQSEAVQERLANIEEDYKETIEDADKMIEIAQKELKAQEDMIRDQLIATRENELQLSRDLMRQQERALKEEQRLRQNMMESDQMAQQRTQMLQGQIRSLNDQLRLANSNVERAEVRNRNSQSIPADYAKNFEMALGARWASDENARSEYMAYACPKVAPPSTPPPTTGNNSNNTSGSGKDAADGGR